MLIFCREFYLSNSLYDLANVVPTLAKFYHQASEAYEQACTRHINMIIYIVRIFSLYQSGILFFIFSVLFIFPISKQSFSFWSSFHWRLDVYLLNLCKWISFVWLQQFERLFQFHRKIEDLMYTITPEEVR